VRLSFIRRPGCAVWDGSGIRVQGFQTGFVWRAYASLTPMLQMNYFREMGPACNISDNAFRIWKCGRPTGCVVVIRSSAHLHPRRCFFGESIPTLHDMLPIEFLPRKRVS
jgi:hypothetical protein